MKSIKPGRGPSAMEGFAAIAAAAFGVIWIIGTVSIGAPGFMSLFGVIFVVMAIVMALYQFHNATARNRMSVLDITDDTEEPDPLNQKYGGENAPKGEKSLFCPYCGNPIQGDYEYCNKCGKKLPV